MSRKQTLLVSNLFWFWVNDAAPKRDIFCSRWLLIAQDWFVIFPWGNGIPPPIKKPLHVKYAWCSVDKPCSSWFILFKSLTIISPKKALSSWCELPLTLHLSFLFYYLLPIILTFRLFLLFFCQYEVGIPDETRHLLDDLGNQWVNFQQTLMDSEEMIKRSKVT